MLRILVIDDDLQIRKAVGRILGSHYLLVEASSDAVARRIITTEHVDAVLCDLHLGDDAGISFYAWLRDGHPRLANRCIFLTGGATCGEEASFLEAHSKKVIQKPFDRAELLGRLNALLSGDLGEHV